MPKRKPVSIKYYAAARKKAKAFYSRIPLIRCPLLNNEPIHFTAAGFNHLLRKGRVLRPEKDQLRRFKLIKYIHDILYDPQSTIVHRREETRDIINRHGVEIKIKSIADFWAFSKIQNGRKITVVIRQLEGKKKHFFSVY